MTTTQQTTLTRLRNLGWEVFRAMGKNEGEAGYLLALDDRLDQYYSRAGRSEQAAIEEFYELACREYDRKQEVRNQQRINEQWGFVE